MGNMDCSFCEEVRRIPAGDFMFYTEAVRQMGRIVRALKSGKNRWKVKQVRENEKMEWNLSGGDSDFTYYQR